MHVRVACNRMCLELPVAYLEAFVVQCAVKPRGRCSETSVGRCSNVLEEIFSVVEHENLTIHPSSSDCP
jgi:hypothetical protein